MALVDAAFYTRVTQDNATSASDVDAALADAQKLAEDHCNRLFEYTAAVTETLDVNRAGLVYPKRRPVAAVSSPSGATVREGGIYVGLVSFDADPLSPLPPQVAVTYSGGYKPYGTGDATIPDVPVKLARVIARIAWLTLHPVVLAGVPAGAKSVSVGDVAVSSSTSLSPFAAMDPSIEADLRGFKAARFGSAARK